MNAANVIVVELHIRWWVQPYIQTVAWFALTFGCDPNIERVAHFIARHGIGYTVASETQEGV